MIMNDPKKVASIIIGKKFSAESMKKGGEDGVAAMQDGLKSDESDTDYAKADAARMLLSAIDSKDASKVVKAFEALFSLCDSAEDSEEGEAE